MNHTMNHMMISFNLIVISSYDSLCDYSFKMRDYYVKTINELHNESYDDIIRLNYIII
jgi:hypothetical protein